METCISAIRSDHVAFWKWSMVHFHPKHYVNEPLVVECLAQRHCDLQTEDQTSILLV